MNDAFTLPDSLSLSDLATYLGRAGRVEDGSVRLIAGSGVLAVYVAVFYPMGLLDSSPTVLGLRTFQLDDRPEFDAVVPVRSLKERLVRLQNDVVDPTASVTVSVPATVNTVTWAAISPPRGGWARLEPIEAARLRATAESGIARVAEAIPEGTGEQIVHRVRADVWSAPVEGAEQVPAGAGFGALSLGFLDGEDEVTIFETGTWTRLTTPKGHVLVKRRSSLL
ncbi:hypothetical protein [Frigoribacterium sp. VKM Ac-2836]|uniref:hypothetical protein n=1 Tax=Frigoribacterium sp. VKM Ac-2836 TaxID=2739014 RepID=UPI001565207F|nr:hypothetical protein [Frigoribacterium sp. VKM Ac-2836]NRD27461.1 hypothetical protein [Frigoribacterium sp. VKM Ac-2836]